MKTGALNPALNFSILLWVLVAACYSSPVMKATDTLPPIVKEYKHLNISPWKKDMVDTGIYLEKGDFFTVLADDSSKRGTLWVQIEHIYNLSEYFSPAPISGKLYVGQPTFSSRQASTGIDIIVWREKNWDQISGFLQNIKAKAKDNNEIEKTWSIAKRYKELDFAIQNTSKEIENRKSEIQQMRNELKEEAGILPSILKEKAAPAERDKEEKLEILEARLAELLETLSQLDEMKRKLATQREKTTQLSKELEEKKAREKELTRRLEDDARTPPVIVIVYPSDQSKVEISVINLSGVIEDNQGITRIEIFINGKPFEAKSERGIRVSGDQGTRRLDLQEKIQLERGINKIKIRAADKNGLTAERILTVHYAESRKNVWAVVIGINEYTKIQKLKYAVNDAMLFHDYLINRNKIPAENVTLLLNREASLKNLRSALGTHLKSRAAQDDMVIIFFAGHGATEKDSTSPDGDGLEKYLLPYDADPQDLFATALPMEDVSNIFKRIRSDRLVFIADSCYSGASGGRTVGISGIRANISDGFLNRISSGKGRVVISASGANEVSVENDDLRQGLFTYHLIEGLNGKADYDQDGSITVDEVYRYVSEQVPAATGKEQNPVLKGTVEGRLVLGVID